MRLLQLLSLFALAVSTWASVVPLIGLAAGATALGASIAKLGAVILPAGLLLPLAIVAPLKVLLGAKALGLLKLKMLKLKAPVVAPVVGGIASKFALAHVKAHLIKSLHGAKLALIEAPLKLKAMKVGAIHGAIAGGKAALAGYESLPKTHFQHPLIIPASELLSPAAPEPLPQPEPAEPSYGRKPPAYSPPAPAYTPVPVTPAAPAYTPASPAYVPIRPAPAYAPAPAPEVQYRKRRQAGELDENTEKIFEDVFNILQERDTDQCLRRTFCAIAVNPEIAKSYGTDVLITLDNLRADSEAPWSPYKEAVAIGQESHSEETCAQEYSSCTKSVEDLIKEAVEQLED